MNRGQGNNKINDLKLLMMNKIFNDDAIAIMDRMIAKQYKVDLLITDPPYKITARGNGGNSGGMFQKKEKKKI